MATIERTLILATVVDNLTQAWTFVMGHVDSAGPDPSITISPIWVEDDSSRRFEVSVSGMVATTEDEP